MTLGFCTHLFLHILGAVFVSASGPIHQAELQSRVQLQQHDLVGCTRLLNANGVVGCGAAELEGVLTSLNVSADILPEEAERGTVILIAAKYLDSFLARLKQNATMHSYMRGVLVDPAEAPEAESPAAGFPLAEFAPYSQPDFVWNPPGTSLDAAAFHFPIILLDNATATNLAQRASDNWKQAHKGALHHVKVSSVMTGEANSSHCLAQQTCQPLGGHSIWAAAPPLGSPHQVPPQMPLIMVLAPMDSTAFFRAKTVGADSAVGSLITLLAVADILANNTAVVRSYSKRLVLTALAGEPWGYMGSKRLLWEMHINATFTRGLDLHNTEQVLEIGQVGQAGTGAGPGAGHNFSFYSHAMRAAPYGDAAELAQALQDAATSMEGLQAAVAPAPDTNPGIPPSSLSSWLRLKPSLKGLVLAEHSTSYVNPFYQSHLDTADRVQAGSLAAAAVLVAKALHSLAAGPDTSALQVNEAAVIHTIAQLQACLLHQAPGLQCLLGQAYLGTNSAAEVEHYIGVLRTVTQDSQDPSPSLKTSIERFVWNYLAEGLSQDAATPPAGPSQACDPYKNRCQVGAVCAAYVPGQKDGRCVNASVSFVPSYSLNLHCPGCDEQSAYQWQQSNASHAWEAEQGWPADPMWTESNWPPGEPSMTVYRKESAAISSGTFMAGLLCLIGSVMGVVIAQATSRQP